MSNKPQQNNTISLDVFRQSGKKGGTKTAMRGKKYYQDIGSKGAKMRWAKKAIENSPTK